MQNFVEWSVCVCAHAKDGNASASIESGARRSARDAKRGRGLSSHIRRYALAALAFVTAGPAFAHHSFAPYEPERQIRLHGTVEKFTWQNPHVYIQLRGAEAGGEEQLWLIECANPGILNRVGWKFNMVKEGDEITVVVAPMRNGQPAALLKAIKTADGRVLSNGGPAGPATIPIDPEEEAAAGGQG